MSKKGLIFKYNIGSWLLSSVIGHTIVGDDEGAVTTVMKTTIQ